MSKSGFKLTIPPMLEVEVEQTYGEYYGRIFRQLIRAGYAVEMPQADDLSLQREITWYNPDGETVAYRKFYRMNIQDEFILALDVVYGIAKANGVFDTEPDQKAKSDDLATSQRPHSSFPVYKVLDFFDFVHNLYTRLDNENLDMTFVGFEVVKELDRIYKVENGASLRLSWSIEQPGSSEMIDFTEHKADAIRKAARLSKSEKHEYSSLFVRNRVSGEIVAFFFHGQIFEARNEPNEE